MKHFNTRFSWGSLYELSPKKDARAQGFFYVAFHESVEMIACQQSSYENNLTGYFCGLSRDLSPTSEVGWKPN